jgi:hypothetical protein
LIGGEGLSSRGHTGQGGEREEVATGGFQRTKTRGKSRVIQSLSYGLSVHIHGSQRRQVWISMGQRRERSHGHLWAREGKVMDALGNMLVQGRTEAQEFPGLSAVYNSLSGPLSLLREP